MALFKYGFSSSKANQDAPDKKRKGRDETKKSYEKEKRMRSFYSKWTDEFPWVEFDETENVMYCIACKIFDKVGRFVEGTSNFRIDTLKQHDASRAHVDAYKRYKVDKMKENSFVRTQGMLRQMQYVHMIVKGVVLKVLKLVCLVL